MSTEGLPPTFPGSPPGPPPKPGLLTGHLFDLLPAGLLIALAVSGPGRLVVEFAAHLT